MPTERKTILVTGVSRGLGRALVAEFIARGHTVLGCARSAEAIAELRQYYGPPHDFSALNVAVNDSVEAWAERVLPHYGPPDLLINNAAVINENRPLWEIGAAEFDLVVDTNLKGVANVIRRFVPTMVARQRGVIVNLSSGWGRCTAPEVAPYCATKWAIEGLTQALAQELPAGMAAIPLNPGIIDTAMLRSCFGAGAGGYPAPEDWARVAAPFLLGLGSRHNGQPLTVPGAGGD